MIAFGNGSYDYKINGAQQKFLPSHLFPDLYAKPHLTFSPNFRPSVTDNSVSEWLIQSLLFSSPARELELCSWLKSKSRLWGLEGGCCYVTKGSLTWNGFMEPWVYELPLLTKDWEDSTQPLNTIKPALNICRASRWVVQVYATVLLGSLALIQSGNHCFLASWHSTGRSSTNPWIWPMCNTGSKLHPNPWLQTFPFNSVVVCQYQFHFITVLYIMCYNT